MTGIGAYAALPAIAPKDALQLHPLRHARLEERLAEPPPPPAAGAGRAAFSAKELGQIMSAAAPLLGGHDADQRANALEGILRGLAEKRAAGEDAVLVVTTIPGGGSMGTIMGAREFEAALASDDPGSLGSFTDDNGEFHSVRDMVRAELGARGGGAATTARDAIWAAIAAQMARVAGDEGAGTASAAKLRDGGAAVALPAKAPGDAGPGGSTVLLDVVV